MATPATLQQGFPQPARARTLYEKLTRRDGTKVDRTVPTSPFIFRGPCGLLVSVSKPTPKSAASAIVAVNPNVFQTTSPFTVVLWSCPADSRCGAGDAINARWCADCQGHRLRRAHPLVSCADGTTSRAKRSLRARKHRKERIALARSLCGDAGFEMRLLREYKFFEPGFYQRPIADWAWPYLMRQKLGRPTRQAGGHRITPASTTIELSSRCSFDEVNSAASTSNTRN